MKIKTKKINYKSKSFVKGLKKIKKLCELSQKQSIPDKDKMHTNFNI